MRRIFREQNSGHNNSTIPGKANFPKYNCNCLKLGTPYYTESVYVIVVARVLNFKQNSLTFPTSKVCAIQLTGKFIGSSNTSWSELFSQSTKKWRCINNLVGLRDVLESLSIICSLTSTNCFTVIIKPFWSPKIDFCWWY